MNLAPIALFTYKRPEHTLRTLTALSENTLAQQSELFIFSDGIKATFSEKDLEAFNKTQEIIKSKNWCKKVTFIKRSENLGCANSIVKGVTQLLESYSKIIVLEDDMLTSPYFLEYMNDGLNLFQDNKSISSINGYSEGFIRDKNFPAYFLLNGADCWGWATWKDRWDDFIFDAQKIKDQIIALNKVKIFEYGNHMSLIELQIKGAIDAWDMQWHGSNVIKGRMGVYSNQTFIKNIGLDGSGTHGQVDEKELLTDKLIFNGYEESLSEYVQVNGLSFNKKIEDSFKNAFKKRFRIPMHRKIFDLSMHIARKIYRILFKRS